MRPLSALAAPTLSMLSTLSLLVPPPARADLRADAVAALEQEHAAGRFTRGSLAIVGPEGQTTLHAFGDGDPLRTIWRLPAVSKVVVAVTALQLEEEGRLDLRAPVGKYLKGLKDLEVPVVDTGQLLTHTGAIPDTLLGALAARPEDLLPLRDTFSRHPLPATAPPGERFAYSNRGFALVGLVVETLRGQSFAEVADARVFEPLAMTRTSFVQPPPGYDVADALRPPLFQAYPAGSLTGTAADIGRLIAALLPTSSGPRILRPETLERLTATHWRAHDSAPGVAYGLFESRTSRGRALFAVGGGGDHSLLYLLPESGFGVFFAAEGDEATALAVRERLAQALATEIGIDESAAPIGSLGGSVGGSDLHGNVAGLYLSNAVNPWTVEKLQALLLQMRVRELPGGRLSVESPLGGPPLAADFASPGVYRPTRGGQLVFSSTADGGRQMTLVGSIWDPNGFHRVSWTQDARLHLGALLAFLAAFFLRPVFGVKWWPLSLVPTLLLLAAFLCAAATPFLFPPPHPDLPWSVRAALALLTAATLAGLVLPFRLPKTRRTLAWMYVLVSAAGFAFVVHYNLYLFFR